LKVLITGAEGFVGSNLTRKLSEDHEVVGLDYLVNRETSNIPRSIPYVNCDLSKSIPPKLPVFDLVAHLASISIERISEKAAYSSVNFASTLNMLELARRLNAKLVLTSSGSVYGNGLNFRESDPFNPMSLYALGKTCEEKYAKYYHDEYGLDVVVLRYSNCFGDTTCIENKFYPGKKDAVRMFMECSMQCQPIPLVKNQERDFTFIDDVVEATCSVIHLTGFNVFNVATGVATDIGDIPLMIGNALSKKVDTYHIPPRSIDNLKKRSLNIGKISRYWKPRFKLEEGIRQYAERM